MSQIESSTLTQYFPLYEKAKFERESSQWRLLYGLLQCNSQFWEHFQVERLFQKVWLLLYKRAKLDLRLTKKVLNLNGVQKLPI